jgi:hypothetical protein
LRDVSDASTGPAACPRPVALRAPTLSRSGEGFGAAATFCATDNVACVDAVVVSDSRGAKIAA